MPVVKVTTMFRGKPLGNKQPLQKHQVMITVKEYRDTLNDSTVLMLWALARYTRPVAKREMKLSNVAYARGHKLLYWGLIGHAEDSTRGGWIITENGRRFLRGEISVPGSVIMLRGKAIRYEGPYVTIKELMPPKVYEDYCAEYREMFA